MVDIARDRAAVVTGSMRRISWGAIIAGAILALAIQFMLGLLGLGIGLASVDPAQSDGPSLETFTSLSGIWTIAIVLVGIFIGAYAAARLAGSPEKTDAMLHGIVTWATSTLIIVYLLTSGASAVIGGAFGAIGSSIQGITQAASAVVPNSLSTLPDDLQQQLQQLLQRGTQAAQDTAGETQEQVQGAVDTAQQATGEQDLTAAMSEIMAGLGEDATQEERQAAVQVIARTAGVSQQEAEQSLQQFQAQYDQAMAQLRQTADQAAAALSTAAFSAFVALLLGLIVGALGGLAGRPRHLVTAVKTA